MKNVVAIILARPTSGRLPQKHFRKIGNKTMIEWVLSRILYTKVIATTQEGKGVFSSFGDVLAPNVNENNTVGRIKEVAKKFPSADYFFIISGDCPVISMKIMEKMLNELDSFSSYDAARPVFTHHVGVELVRASSIHKLKDGEHFSITLSDLEELHVPIGDKTDLPVRITVDNLADLELQKQLHDILGEKYSYENIINIKNTDIFKINSHVGQKSVDKVSKNIYISTRGDEKIGLGHVARSVALAQYYSEYCNDNVRIFTNNNPIVDKYLSTFGYIKNLDYYTGLPVEDTNDFSKNIFIHDLPEKTTLDYNDIYKQNPTFAVNQRLRYIKDTIDIGYLVSFGKGRFREYGVKIYDNIPSTNKKFIYDVDDLAPYLAGAKTIITMWSQTAREAIFIGKVPIVYSASREDDDVCKVLDKKGIIKYKGRLE